MYIQGHVVSVLRGGYAQVAVQWISSLSELPQTAFRKSVSEHTVSYGIGFCLLSERAGRTNCLARCSRADSWEGGWPPTSLDCSSRTSLHHRGRRHASGAVSATQRILRSCSGASGARWERPDESFVVVRPQGLAWMRCGYLAVDFVCIVPFARSRAEQGEESCSGTLMRFDCGYRCYARLLAPVLTPCFPERE